MRTLLTRFCEEFVDIIGPLREPLRRVNEAITLSGESHAQADPGSQADPGQADLGSQADAGSQADRMAARLQPVLGDLRAQIDQLAAKVGEQQAYVLIFGPLKSGKSTLMNSIAEAYVSEVSSLPAYPCMVFVSHAQSREYAVQSYDGETRTFQDPAALQDHVDAAHADLAEHIRQAESTGRQFDPQQNLPSAIRRIDVRLPATALTSAKAVLVDTPGLYSRMKFGYDRMTRDFRNAAACAVFVVRSDNLFLEQVFAEFNRLLELFSRIFLIVNLDSTKRDLAPDGELVPSLEQRDPSRVVKAFETLAMSAPLKKAAAEGRLRIYPVDLLRAASRRIRKDKADADPDTPDTGFGRFADDLTKYLGSPDYLRAFLGDSIRRAEALFVEAAEVQQRPEVRELDDELARIESEQAECNRQLELLRRLPKHDWQAPFQRLSEELRPLVETHGADVGSRVLSAVHREIERWFHTDDSLHGLARDSLGSAFVRYQEEFTAAVSRELSERVLKGSAGIRLPEAIQENMRATGIDFDAVGRDAHAATDRDALIVVPPNPVRSETVPVRRRVVDRLLLRNRHRVRQRLLGADATPQTRVPEKQKARRIGLNGKLAIRQQVDSYAKTFFAETVDRLSGAFLDSFRQAATDNLLGRIDTRSRALHAEIAALESRREWLRRIRNPLTDLGDACSAATEALGLLSQAYGRVDAAELARPLVPEHDRILPARPPSSASGTTTASGALYGARERVNGSRQNG